MRASPHPVCVAQIVDTGLAHPLVRDEVYAQLIRHLTGNPSYVSTQRGWHLMLVALSCFPPSEHFENTLEWFLRSQGESHCVNALHRTVFTGATAEAPTLEEVEAAEATTITAIGLDALDPDDDPYAKQPVPLSKPGSGDEGAGADSGSDAGSQARADGSGAEEGKGAPAGSEAEAVAAPASAPAAESGDRPRTSTKPMLEQQRARWRRQRGQSDPATDAAAADDSAVAGGDGEAVPSASASDDDEALGAAVPDNGAPKRRAPALAPAPKPATARPPPQPPASRGGRGGHGGRGGRGGGAAPTSARQFMTQAAKAKQSGSGSSPPKAAPEAMSANPLLAALQRSTGEAATGASRGRSSVRGTTRGGRGRGGRGASRGGRGRGGRRSGAAADKPGVFGVANPLHAAPKPPAAPSNTADPSVDCAGAAGGDSAGDVNPFLAAGGVTGVSDVDVRQEDAPPASAASDAAEASFPPREFAMNPLSVLQRASK